MPEPAASFDRADERPIVIATNQECYTELCAEKCAQLAAFAEEVDGMDMGLALLLGRSDK
jgi:hypothetical protein